MHPLMHHWERKCLEYVWSLVLRWCKNSEYFSFNGKLIGANCEPVVLKLSGSSSRTKGRIQLRGGGGFSISAEVSWPPLQRVFP